MPSSPQTSVLDVVATALGRDLTSEERRWLRQLSPQGVAKLNSDLLNGTDVVKTLADFKTVFTKMQERRSNVAALVPTEAQQVIEQIGRPATLDELTLFSSFSLSSILSDVTKRMNEGETFGSAVEELANEYKYQRLSADAAAFGETQSLPTRINVLTPVLRPSTPNGLAPNMATIRKRKISVGLSPIVLWFKPGGNSAEGNDDDIEDDEMLAVMSTAPSLASTSKRLSNDSLTTLSACSSMRSLTGSCGSSRFSSPKRVSILDEVVELSSPRQPQSAANGNLSPVLSPKFTDGRYGFFFFSCRHGSSGIGGNPIAHHNHHHNRSESTESLPKLVHSPSLSRIGGDDPRLLLSPVSASHSTPNTSSFPSTPSSPSSEEQQNFGDAVRKKGSNPQALNPHPPAPDAKPRRRFLPALFKILD